MGAPIVADLHRHRCPAVRHRLLLLELVACQALVKGKHGMEKTGFVATKMVGATQMVSTW